MSLRDGIILLKKITITVTVKFELTETDDKHLN